MPRRAQPSALPVLPVPTGDDPLLTAEQAASSVGISKARWWGYAKRYAYLLSGRRCVQARPGTKGRFKWLQSYVTAHKHLELPRDRQVLVARSRASASPTPSLSTGHIQDGRPQVEACGVGDPSIADRKTSASVGVA